MKTLLSMVGAVMLLSGPGSVLAQDQVLPGTVTPGAGQANPLEHSGAGVFHGNYCGIGDRGAGLPAVDALDEACMHHDACTPEGGLPSCACNARFQREIHAVAASPAQPDDLRALASTVEAGIPIIPCR